MQPAGNARTSNPVVPGASSSEEVAPSLFDASEPPNFLFVNETSNASQYKQGNRHDVRSHIRKYAAKQFGITHKTPRKRAQALPKYAPLTTQGLDSGSSKALEHDRNCPLSVPPTLRQGVSTRSDSLSAAPTLIEIDESRHENSPDSADADSPEASELHRGLIAYCRACGQPLNRLKLKYRYLLKDGSLVRRNLTGKILSNSSPVQAFGAGRIDPFSSLPVDEADSYSRELIDHAVTYLMPGLIPDEPRPGEVNPLSKAWFTSGLRTPLLFHALVYSGSNHLDFMRWSNIFPNAPKPLSHKLVVIRKLNEALSDPSLASSDEVILAILILASQEVFISKKITRNPFNSPLKTLGWLNVYGNFKFVPQHVKAVGEIVTMRGGLENLKLNGLAEIITSGDVVSATNSISKPGFPTLKKYVASITTIRVWAISPPRPLIQTQAAAFWRLEEYGITDFMLHVFDSIGALTLAIEYHLAGKRFELGLGAINRTRTAIQQRLLSLPASEELEISPPSSSQPNIYECCRLTALIYGVAVVYPIPNSHDVFQELVRRLMDTIQNVDIKMFGIDLFGVLLWMVVLGGIAALNTPERPWFTSKLAFIVRRLDIEEWAEMENILGTFLWLECACSQAGRELWDEALAVADSAALRLTPDIG